ncbi:2-oxo acid dehydrogenase subunit E2 [Buchnera aphidicola (Astegopteryx bambusae)]|uniref:2-oxo acid dehydrogenase subunit E2 n=1 Tax=Buchnera aphidicola TaxID=9 RepID=UPI0031B872D1
MYKTVKIPDVGKEELEVVEILIKVGDFIKKNQNIIVIEGEKTSIEIPSKKDGKVKKIFLNIGDKVTTNSKILLLKSKIKNKIFEDKVYNLNDKFNKNNDIDTCDKIYASPMVRRLARKNDVNLLKIKGTGEKNRISKEDFFKYLENSKNKHNKIYKNNFLEKQFDFENFGEVEKISLNKIQKVVSKNLYDSWSKIPHVTQFDEIDITRLEKFRKKINLDIISKNVSNSKITLLPFIIKSLGHALKKFKNFNSSYSQKDDILFLKKYINIGIVVNSKNGLFIPVIKNILEKSILNISNDIKKFAKNIRSNCFNNINMKGGNFTVSSLGGYGGGHFTPIINYPEVAILGISKFFHKNIFLEKKMLNKIILPISLSYDHRVINGVEALNFINFIKVKLEEFYNFIIE